MKLTPKVKKFVKKQTITSVIITQKMKLAALAKGLKAKTETRDRFRNNKLYRCKKKAFNAKIGAESSGRKEITDPPTKEEITEFWDQPLEQQRRTQHEGKVAER